MKTSRKIKEKKAIKGFETLKMNELILIRGGEGEPTQRDNDFSK